MAGVYIVVLMLLGFLIQKAIGGVSLAGAYWAVRILLGVVFVFLCALLFARVDTPVRVIDMKATGRIRLKFLALVFCLMVMLLYSKIMSALGLAPLDAFVGDISFFLPLVLVLLFSFVRWADVRTDEPDDQLYKFAGLLVGRDSWCWEALRPFVMSWCVKIMFFPLMYSFLVISAEQLVSFEWGRQPFHEGFFLFGLTFDLLIATFGYLFTSRLLGAPVISVDSTWEGWLVCMICYPPLLMVLSAVKKQSDDFIWTDWALPDTGLYWAWAALIISSWVVYWLSSVAFGIRFSNLSWRGLVNRGPYRFTKHPAYISKNIYWWAYTVPFFSVVGLDMARNFLGLVFVSMIYYLRAKTEERHLSQFREYASYSRWIRRYGLWGRAR